MTCTLNCDYPNCDRMNPRPGQPSCLEHLTLEQRADWGRRTQQRMMQFHQRKGRTMTAQQHEQARIAGRDAWTQAAIAQHELKAAQQREAARIAARDSQMQAAIAQYESTPPAPIDLAARFASAPTRIATEIVARVAASDDDTVVPTIPLDEIFQQQQAAR